MRYQKSSYSCGAAAVVNALKALGKNVSERRVRVFSNTTEKDGTADIGIINVIKEFKFKYNTFESETLETAWQFILNNQPVICSAMNDEHWVVVIGKLINKETKVIVVDSSNSIKNSQENGVRVMAKREFMKYWRGKKNKFFGIQIIKP
jgi:ABC-type bacteriocin/lantibiotic exporter with double-glycine peptidase domain